MKKIVTIVMLGTISALLFFAFCFGFAQTQVREASHRTSYDPARIYRQQVMNHLTNDALTAWKDNHDPAAAERIYRQALQTDPDNPGTWHRLAQLLDEQGKGREAMEAYDHLVHPRDRTVFGSSDDCVILYRYAHLREQYGNSQEAMQTYRRMLALAPTNHWQFYGDVPVNVNMQEADDVRACACLLAGFNYATTGRAAEALRCYREAANAQPRWPVAHYYLGQALASAARGLDFRGNHPQALRLTQEAASEALKADRLGDADFRQAAHWREDEQKQRDEACKKTWRGVMVSRPFTSWEDMRQESAHTWQMRQQQSQPSAKQQKIDNHP